MLVSVCYQNDKTTVIIHVHIGLTLSQVLKVVSKPRSPKQKKVSRRTRRQRKRNLKLQSYYFGTITWCNLL